MHILNVSVDVWPIVTKFLQVLDFACRFGDCWIGFGAILKYFVGAYFVNVRLFFVRFCIIFCNFRKNGTCFRHVFLVWWSSESRERVVVQGLNTDVLIYGPHACALALSLSASPLLSLSLYMYTCNIYTG